MRSQPEGPFSTCPLGASDSYKPRDMQRDWGSGAVTRDREASRALTPYRRALAGRGQPPPLGPRSEIWVRAHHPGPPAPNPSIFLTALGSTGTRPVLPNARRRQGESGQAGPSHSPEVLQGRPVSEGESYAYGEAETIGGKVAQRSGSGIYFRREGTDLSRAPLCQHGARLC